MRNWFKKREAEKLITDWAPIDRIDAFRLGQWAAIICGYDFVADPKDDPALRPWKHEFFHLKRAIESGRFVVAAAPDKHCDRETMVQRSEITWFFEASGERRPLALFFASRQAPRL